MEIRRYLPSTRFAVFVLAIAVAIGLVIAASYVGAGKPISSAIAIIAKVPTGKSEVGDTDTDGDGLRDWEEGVRGTNPAAADTDGDGTSDKAEVAANRDPNKPGPDDSLINEASNKFLAELLEAASSTNMTDDLSRTIFARYVAARGEGSSGDIQTQESVVSEALSKAEVEYRGIAYTLEDITVVSDTITATRFFANESMMALLRHPDANFVYAMQVFGSSMDGAPGAVKELRRIGTEYRTVAKEMSRVPVPRSYAERYLLAINALDIGGAAFEDMAQVGEDPIRAIAGLQNYDRMLTSGAGVFVLIARDIKRSGLTFSKNEAGLGWDEFAGIANPS